MYGIHESLSAPFAYRQESIYPNKLIKKYKSDPVLTVKSSPIHAMEQSSENTVPRRILIEMQETIGMTVTI